MYSTQEKEKIEELYNKVARGELDLSPVETIKLSKLHREIHKDDNRDLESIINGSLSAHDMVYIRGLAFRVKDGTIYKYMMDELPTTYILDMTKDYITEWCFIYEKAEG